MNAVDVVIDILYRIGFKLRLDGDIEPLQRCPRTTSRIRSVLYYIELPYYGIDRWLSIGEERSGHVYISILSDWSTLASKEFDLALPNSLDEITLYGYHIMSAPYSWRQLDLAEKERKSI